MIVDSAQYPRQIQLSVSISNLTESESFELSVCGKRVHSADTTGVWWRRPKAHQFPNVGFSKPVRQFCLQESAASFEGWLHSCAPKVINPLSADSYASHKVAQLTRAAKAGLHIPDTIVTNSQEEAKMFVSSSSKSTVFKVLTGARFLFADTRRITQEHCAFFDALANAPIILQREVVGKRDIRVTIIDRDVFAAEIVPNHKSAQLDWRLDASANILRHALPVNLETSLVDFVKSLGLRYGAIDMALDPNGNYVFLEINPGGQFLFVEIHSGQPISAAIAKALISGPP